MGGEMANVVRLTQDNDGELDRPILGLSNRSADADVPSEGVGQALCEARQRSGKTLMDVSRGTKIPPHHLITIEAGCFEALPGRVYAIGFVRCYSAYLGLDAEAFAARLRAEMPEPDAQDLGPLPPPERKAPEAEFAGSADAKVPVVDLFSPPERKLQHKIIAGLLVAVLIYSGYHVFASNRRMAQPPPVMPVPARLAAEADLPPKHVVAPPLAPVEPAPALPTEPEPALVPSTEVATTEPPAVEPITTVEPAPALPIEPPIASSTPIAKAKSLSVRPAAEKERAQTSRKRAIASSTRVAPTQPLSVRPLATVEPAPSPPAELALLAPAESPTQPVAVAAEPRPMFRAPLPLGRRYGIENGSTRIILRVHRSIRLAVQGTDNRIFIDRILDAGDTYRVPNLVGLKLSAPDAGAIEVILDDTTIGFAGKDGVMASGLSLEPQSIMDRRQQG